MKKTQILGYNRRVVTTTTLFFSLKESKTMAKEAKSALDLNVLTDAQRKRLRDGINASVVQKTYIKDLTASLKDSVKELADELGVEVSDLNSAISSVVAQNFFDKVKKQDNVETILTISGLLSQAGGED